MQEALASRISKKIEVLKAEQICLREETKLNDDLGRQISVRVMQLAQPNECEKYKLHVEETDKIASLIFGLAGRLAKTENSLLLLGDGGGGGGDAQKEKVRPLFSEMKFRFHEALKHCQGGSSGTNLVAVPEMEFYCQSQLLFYNPHRGHMAGQNREAAAAAAATDRELGGPCPARALSNVAPGLKANLGSDMPDETTDAAPINIKGRSSGAHTPF